MSGLSQKSTATISTSQTKTGITQKKPSVSTNVKSSQQKRDKSLNNSTQQPIVIKNPTYNTGQDTGRNKDRKDLTSLDLSQPQILK